MGASLRDRAGGLRPKPIYVVLAILALIPCAGCAREQSPEVAQLERHLDQIEAQARRPIAFPVATEKDKLAAAACTKKYGGGAVNPLYVQRFGRCPQDTADLRSHPEGGRLHATSQEAL